MLKDWKSMRNATNAKVNTMFQYNKLDAGQSPLHGPARSGPIQDQPFTVSGTTRLLGRILDNLLPNFCKQLGGDRGASNAASRPSHEAKFVSDAAKPLRFPPGGTTQGIRRNVLE